MSHYWKAEVTVTGVTVITPAEFEAVMNSLPGEGGLDRPAKRRWVHLFWRWSNKSPDIWDAVEQASAVWRGAVAHIESAVDPVCTDFRVYQVNEL